MNKFHLAYLNLGSNIQPEMNLPKAVALLSKHGKIAQISQVWESEPVGTRGANYLNACVLFKAKYSLMELKDRVTLPIEAQLGRQRTADKFAPRPMDIDIILFDDEPVNNKVWDLAFVVVPLAEIYPEYQVAVKGESVLEMATRLRREVWLETRQGVVE
jgi:2-amino-4-hydroxy-6-hydroxymethyldihydropteridine diphosphokinase